MLNTLHATWQVAYAAGKGAVIGMTLPMARVRDAGHTLMHQLRTTQHNTACYCV